MRSGLACRPLRGVPNSKISKLLFSRSHVVDDLEVHLLAVALVSDPDHQDARVFLPFALNCLM